MKTKILITMLVIASQFVGAQVTEVTQPKIKNDIGFNTNFILNGIFNTSNSPFSFVYKRQKTEQSALRFGVSFNFNLNSISGTPANYSLQNLYSINPSIGKEWQLQLSKKWIWYYGIDIRSTFSEYRYSYYNDGQTSSESYRSYSGLSVAPFLGIRFVISEKLYAATEANLNVGYNYQKGSDKSFNNGTQISSQEYSSNGFTAGTASAFGIFMFYRF